MDREAPEQQIEQIDHVLAKARKLWQDKKVDLALYELDTVTGILEGLVLPGACSGTVNNAGLNAKSLEVKYFSQVGAIMYKIGRYEEALDMFKMARQKKSTEILLYKALGDCCRKLQWYEDALKYYDDGLKRFEKNAESLSSLDKAALLISKGLLKGKTGHFKDALECFNGALDISPTSPLFYCHRGNALNALGMKEQADAAYNKASQLLKDKATRSQHRLSSSHVDFIQRQIQTFKKRAEEIHKINVQVKDEEDKKIIEERVQQLYMNRDEDSKKQVSKDIEEVKDLKSRIKFIEDEGNENVYDYYESFRYTMYSAYQTATNIENGAVKIETGDTATEIACHLARFIPIVGDTVATLIDTVENKANEIELKRNAVRVVEFAPDDRDLSQVVQDAISELAFNNYKTLKHINPEDYILPQWESKLMGWAANQLQSATDKIYGNRYKTAMQRLGFKHASELMANEIATGNVYGTKLPSRMRFKEKKAKLIEYTQKMLDADLVEAKKKYEEKKVEVPEGKSKCSLM